jgi:hypothetical protein
LTHRFAPRAIVHKFVEDKAIAAVLADAAADGHRGPHIEFDPPTSPFETESRTRYDQITDAEPVTDSLLHKGDPASGKKAHKPTAGTPYRTFTGRP